MPAHSCRQTCINVGFFCTCRTSPLVPCCSAPLRSACALPVQVQDFHDWLRSLDFKHKLVIAGNHDVTFDGPYYERTGRARFHEYHRTRYDAAKTRGILADSPDVTYLEDAGCSFQMHGCRVNVYGSPWQPEFCEWAFNYPYDGPEAKRLWRAIPSATDVLITHGPPYGKGDCTVFYKSVGCEVLLHEVTTRVRPLVCVSGHIHEGYGVRRDEHTMYVNASTLDEDYRCVNAAIVFDLPVHAGGGDDPSGGAEPGGPTTTARLGRPVVVASQVRACGVVSGAPRRSGRRGICPFL